MPEHIPPANPSSPPSDRTLIRELKLLHRRLFELEKLEADHKLAITQLIKERDFSRSLVRAFPVLFFVLDHAGAVAMMNDMLLKALGCSRKQALGKPFVDTFVPAEKRPDFLRNFKESLRSRRPYQLACSLQPRKGALIDVEWQFSPVFRADGEFDYFFGVGTDVSAHRKAASAVRSSQQRLLDIINFLPDATFAIDRKGTVIAWNHAIEELTGVKAQDILGKGNFEYALFFYGQRRPILIDLVLRQHKMIEQKFYTMLRRENGTLIAETEFSRPQGRKRILWAKAAILYDAKGNKIGAIESIRDITESKTEHRILEESERKYRFLAENIRDIVWVMDTRLRHTFVSPAVTTLLGYSVEEAMNTDFKDVITPATYAYLRKRLKEIREQHSRQRGKASQYYTEELQVRHKNGSLRWLEARFCLLSDPRGRMVALQGISRDITERKNIETALRESEERYRRIVETANEGIWGMNEEYITTFVNQKMADMLGLVPEEMVGKPFADFVAPEDLDDHREKIALSVQGEDARFERRFRHKDGSVRWMLVSATPLRNAAGGFGGAFAMFTDITGRKRMEELVQAQHRKFEMLSEQSPLGIMMLTLAGKLSYVNNRFTEITGYSLEDLPDGATWFKRAFPDEPARKQVVAEWISDTRTMRPGMKHVRVCREGSQKIVSFHTVALEDGGWLVYCEDITALKIAEEALRESEERFRALAEESPIAIYLTDQNGDCLYVNRCWSEMSGLTFEQSLGKGWLEGVHPDDRALIDKEWPRLVASEGKWGLECRFCSPEGKVTFVLGYAVSWRDPDGSVKGYIGTNIDITERKRAEAALRLSEEKFSKAFHSSADGMTISSLETGRIIETNEATEKIFGYSRSEAIGKTSVELGIWVDDQDRKRLLQALDSAAAHMRILQRRKSGESFVASVSAERIVIDGEACLLATVRDVTEMELAQQALRERENKLNSIFRAAPIGIGLVVNRVIQQVNDCFCKMTGYAAGELTGREARMLYPAQEDYEFVGRVKYDQIRKTGMGTVETRWLRKDGVVINVLLSSVPLDQSDWSKGMIFTALDISERVRIQESMTAALKEKEILLKEINHRVKNNLQVVSSLINLQSKSLKDPDDRVMFKDCQSRIKSMVLIHERLYYLKSLTKIDFTKYIHDLAAGLFASYVVDTKKIKFRINVVDNITLTVNHAIPCGLIVNELVSNALKHAFSDSRQGEICIDFRQEPDTTYTLSIEDNGKGLPAGMDVYRTPSLGLQIVLTLVEQLNGTFEVLRNKGTLFKIRFK